VPSHGLGPANKASLSSPLSEGSSNTLNSGFKPITASYPSVNNYVGNPQLYTSAPSNVSYLYTIYFVFFEKNEAKAKFSLKKISLLALPFVFVRVLPAPGEGQEFRTL
jgi:hypothetical protein